MKKNEDAFNAEGGSIQEESIGKQKKSKKKKKKKWLKWLVFLIILAGVGVGVYSCSERLRGAANLLMTNPVSAQNYALHDMSEYVLADGYLYSSSVTQVVTSLSYPVKEIYVELGDRVKQGDLLCEIDSSEIDKLIAKLEEQATDADKLQAKQLEITSHGIINAQNNQNTAEDAAKKAISNAKNNYDNAVAKRNELIGKSQSAATAAAEAKAQLEISTAEYNEVLTALTEAKKSAGIVATSTDAVSQETQAEVEVREELKQLSLEELQTLATQKKAEMEAAKALLSAAELEAGTIEKALEQLSEDVIEQLKQAYETATAQYQQTVQSGNQTMQSLRDQAELQSISQNSYSELANQLAEAYIAKGKTIITAQQDGIITALPAVEGRPANGMLMTIEDDTKLQIKISVKDTDISKLKEGQDVIITSDYLADLESKGVITKAYLFKSSAAGTGSDPSGLFSAIIDVTENDGLLLGMTVKTKIVVSDEGEKMSVPYTSIFEENGTSYVYTAERDQTGVTYTIVKKSVITGVKGEYYTEILSGLEPDEVVISYPDGVKEGQTQSVIVKSTDK